MKAPLNTRYAHCDGITGIAWYTQGTEEKILTCGSDGDVRVWKNPEDKDPFVFSSSEAGLALCTHGEKVYVGTENNCVEVFGLPGGEPEGNAAKFTAAVNDLDVSKSGEHLVAGSGDMTIQVVKLDNSGSPITIKQGHTAPILSVVIDPKEEFFASSGCDGQVCIWTLSEGKQVKVWDDVFRASNDITTSKTLCRVSWKGDGKVLAVPKMHQVILYWRGDWVEDKRLTCPSDSKVLSVTLFSPCQKYLAAASTDGTIFVWDVDTSKLLYENSDTKDHITGILISKSSKNIVAVDMKGRMLFVNDFASVHETQKPDFNIDDELAEDDDFQVDKDAVADDDPFGDEMDDELLAAADGEDVNEISISKIKAMTGFIESEKEDVFVGVQRAKKITGIRIDDDDAVSVTSVGSNSRPAPEVRTVVQQVPIEIPFTEPQKAFQPSSSPESLKHRFMVWNSVGLIRNYEMEEDDLDAIDIEFHDVSFHNGIHLRNQHDYTIAALGKDAVVFASPCSKKDASKIMCLHYSSWDSNKEWSIDLPSREEALTAAIGSGWFAIGTDLNRIRLFSVGGVQRNIIEVGGQIICMSAHEDLLFFAYHSGIGLHGNQAVSYTILRIRSGTGLFPLISSEPLPLSPKSIITWIGFSDEGSPAYCDSEEVLRIMNGRTWTTFLSMKETSRSDSDHYWVTGLSVCNQHVRVIKCKGVRYPPTIPRPTLLLLDAKIPLCEIDSEKSQLEDTWMRSLLQNVISRKMDKKGFDVEMYREKSEKDIKENLMKLFAMCCKSDKDFRASEYVSMMPSTHAVQIAIKYANKLRKMALTDRLTSIGRKKLDEEEEGLEEDDDDFENLKTGNVIYSSVYSTLGNTTANQSSSSMFSSSNLSSSLQPQPQPEVVFLEENPLLARQRAEISALCSTPSSYKNPFKKDGSETKPKASNIPVEKSADDSGKGLALIDAWKKPSEKPAMEFNPKASNSKGAKKTAKTKNDNKGKDKDKESSVKSNKKQPTLFSMTGRKSNSESAAEIDENSSKSEELIIEDTEVEVEPQEKKRKRIASGGEEAEADNEKRSRISSKLSAFALKRKNDNDTEELCDV